MPDEASRPIRGSALAEVIIPLAPSALLSAGARWFLALDAPSVPYGGTGFTLVNINSRLPKESPT